MGYKYKWKWKQKLISYFVSDYYIILIVSFPKSYLREVKDGKKDKNISIYQSQYKQRKKDEICFCLFSTLLSKILGYCYLRFFFFSSRRATAPFFRLFCLPPGSAASLHTSGTQRRMAPLFACLPAYCIHRSIQPAFQVC